MSEVRTFTCNDVAEVADLFAEVFLHDQAVDFDDLRSHFQAIYFDSPFRDDDCPSLVYLGPNGDITAFLGVMARRMQFRSESIRTAIAGNLMIKGAKGGHNAKAGAVPSYASQLAPVAMIKTFFRYPYDLALTDSAVEPSRRIWERCGGYAIRLSSLRWVRVLKPFTFGLGLVERRARLRPLTRLARPFGPLLDPTITRLVSAKKPALPAGIAVSRIDPEGAVEELSRCSHFDLVPSYSSEDLAWILQMTRARKRHGELRTLAVHDAGGRCLGWAIYAGVAGEVGQVLQLYAHPETFDHVFECLLLDAAESGVSALSGKADPLFIGNLSKSQCQLRVHAWSLAQARRPELLQPFFVGKALFTDLESEGWTRFLGASPRREFELA